MTLDWDDLLTVYRTALEDGAAPDRVVRRYLVQHALPADGAYLTQHGRQAAGVAGICTELERRLEAEPVATLPPLDPPPTEPAPLFPPPPPSAPQAEPAPSLPELAQDARQEPLMPEATAPRATDLARLHRKGISAILSSPGLSQDDQVEALSELAAKTIDAATDTGPLEEIDGEMMSHGFKALFFFLHELGERDPGNLRARADRAAARGNSKRAERLRKIATEIEARG